MFAMARAMQCGEGGAGDFNHRLAPADSSRPFGARGGCKPKQSLQWKKENPRNFTTGSTEAASSAQIRPRQLLFFHPSTGFSTPRHPAAGAPCAAAASARRQLGSAGRGKSELTDITDITDILPTLADFSGATLPKDHPLDGRSLAPVLRGETGQDRDGKGYLNVTRSQDAGWCPVAPLW